LPGAAVPGSSAQLTLVLENRGSITLSPQARIFLVPADDRTKTIGEHQIEFRDGTWTITFRVGIPPGPGTCVYTFTPVLLLYDRATGQDIAIQAGDPIQVTIIVGNDGTVQVTSP
jgi:hypothetical protein